ncbi:MAG TPA: hypothetical protein PK691_12535, partial [Thermomicrobiales bacterium]|nr:hypothetical protein [Thermomicrobiales bacterium]
MKITDIVVTVEETPVKHYFHWRKGLPDSGTTNITARIEIQTDEGVTGVAYSSHGTIVRDIFERQFKPAMIGRDPMLKEDLWERVWEFDRLEETPMYVLGLADIALWDMTAKIAGLPLYKVIGGYRDRIPAYASTVTFETTEEFLHVADQCLDYGFKAIKLHAWGDYRKDAKLCQDLRKHVGDEIDLMY